MIHLGDITKIDGSKILPVDVIIGGSPCQDLSIAGKREGLSGERSGLFMAQIRIIKEMHKEYGTVYPRFMVWENVPGALSSNKEEDFRIVLEETARIAEADAVIPGPPKGKWKNSGCVMGDGWSIAWRILDARFWGVPQRRRRIALVADFGGESAPEILFERKGVSGYSADGFRSWQRTAGVSEKGTGAAGCVCLNDQGGSRMDVTEDVAATLRAENHGHPPCVMGAAGFCTEHSARSRSIGYEEETSPTLRAGTVPAVVYENHSQNTRYTDPLETAPTVMSTYGTGGNNQPFVVETPKTLKIRSGCEGGGNPSCNQGGMAVVAAQGSVIGRSDKNGSRGSSLNEDVSFTLDAADRHAVAYCMTTGTYTQILKEQPPTLMARDYKDPPVVNEAGPECVVRRLTPTECERLQGFPDGWTDIGDYIDSKGKKKHTSDTARYKALGNSIALPPWRWVLKRLCNQYDRCVTMGSLFDGIGGFPLIWEEINGKGSCLWASEIEEFPIAVTKIRFSE